MVVLQKFLKQADKNFKTNAIDVLCKIYNINC
jgi:hypothetical protein